MVEKTPIYQKKDLPLGSSTTCRLESLEPHLHVVVSIEVLPFLPLLLAACVDHGLSCPLARLSTRLTEVQWGVLFVLLSHSLHLMTLGGKFSGFTECSKQFLYSKRLSAGICPCKEWVLFVS